MPPSTRQPARRDVGPAIVSAEVEMRTWILLIAAGCAEGAACKAEGEGYDVKALIEGPCCEGLTAANTSEGPDADGACQVNDLNPAKVCIACGDGACGEAENVCNCPDDCT
jgi:hypothetical protein